MSEDIFKQYCSKGPFFERALKELLSVIKDVLSDMASKYHIRYEDPIGRVKDFSSIKRKIKKLGIPEGNTFKAITDIVGARIVCNNLQDVYEIYTLIKQNPQIKILKTRDMIEKPLNSGYQALHLDVRFEIIYENKKHYINCEIQIRTLIQNAWANLVHDDIYKASEDIPRMISETSKHLGGLLRIGDGIAQTIREEISKPVLPPSRITEADTTINSKTLSYIVNGIYKKELSEYEIRNSIERLKEFDYNNIAEVRALLQDEDIKEKIKNVKQKMGLDEEINPFEILSYGSMIDKGIFPDYKEEMLKDYGYEVCECDRCGNYLTTQELEFMKNSTDEDLNNYCEICRGKELHKCERCGLILTCNKWCANCEASIIKF